MLISTSLKLVYSIASTPYPRQRGRKLCPPLAEVSEGRRWTAQIDSIIFEQLLIY